MKRKHSCYLHTESTIATGNSIIVIGRKGVINCLLLTCIVNIKTIMMIYRKTRGVIVRCRKSTFTSAALRSFGLHDRIKNTTLTCRQSIIKMLI